MVTASKPLFLSRSRKERKCDEDESSARDRALYGNLRPITECSSDTTTGEEERREYKRNWMREWRRRHPNYNRDRMRRLRAEERKKRPLDWKPKNKHPVREKICECGARFTTRSPRKIRCTPCQREHNKILQRMRSRKSYEKRKRARNLYNEILREDAKKCITDMLSAYAISYDGRIGTSGPSMDLQIVNGRVKGALWLEKRVKRG